MGQKKRTVVDPASDYWDSRTLLLSNGFLLSVANSKTLKVPPYTLQYIARKSSFHKQSDGQ